MIRKILQDHIKNNVPESEVAVMLSGGVDSISVAIAAQDVGKRIFAYTFNLKNSPSYDSLKAKEVSDKMGWDCSVIEVPTENLLDDWKILVDHGCRKKTHFECVFPFLYVYPEVKQKYVLTGWGSDGYFQPGKKAYKRYRDISTTKKYIEVHRKNPSGTPRVTWSQFRTAYLDGDCAGLSQHTNLVEKHNKIHVTPYLDPKVRELFWNKTWPQLNRPRQKEPVRADFPELEMFTIKNHENLHLNAGIPKIFEVLLDDPDINFLGRKRMMDVCRDWHKRGLF